MRVRIAARKSDLARLQARLVGKKLQDAHPGLTVEYLFKESLGDINLTDPLWKAPEKGVFTEDFYQDLTQARCDLVVHSWKDLPIVDKPDTRIAGTLHRADARDLLLIKKTSRARTPAHLLVLSSSPRRNYNLTPFFRWSLPWTIESVRMESVRGNIPTRVRKLVEGDADGLIVAKAALDRLLSSREDEFQEVQKNLREMLQHIDFQVIPYSINPPCAGQGALALETRRNDPGTRRLVEAISDSETMSDVLRERAILKSYGGGCHQKIGVWISQKSYGTISILKGLTDSGAVLEGHTVEHPTPPPRRTGGKLISGGEILSSQREPIASRPPVSDGWIVARAEALPSDWPTQNQLIWTAGLETWRRLSARGVFVHGSFEGLGETAIDLPFWEARNAPRTLSWTKLTHQGADSDFHPITATYRLHIETPQKIHPDGFYFWRSLSQFLTVQARHPEIREALHACGPGNTYKGLQKHISRDRLWAFFNEEDWRNQCQA